VHIVREPEPAIAHELAVALPGIALSFGDKPPAATEILVAGRPTASQLEACPQLQALIIPWAGLPKPTAELMLSRPHVSIHNLHHNAAATAEMAIALLLAAAKSIPRGDAALRLGDWSMRFEFQHAVQLEGRNALVLGLGEIGRRVARACTGLGMSVSAISRNGRAVDGIDVSRPERLRELLPKADALLICLPATTETEGLLGEAELALLPRQCVLVNVARGAIIDEAALFHALKEGRIFAAGLDVWWRYPQGEAASAPSEYPFHELPNVVMSPHRGGHVQDTEQQRYRALAQLLQAAARGEDMPNRVNLENGY
jgi:phosphoglycerate dehydrogenase-like enzyme